MEDQELIQRIRSLPKIAQREVETFVAFLEVKHTKKKPRKATVAKAKTSTATPRRATSTSTKTKKVVPKKRPVVKTKRVQEADNLVVEANIAKPKAFKQKPLIPKTRKKPASQKKTLGFRAQMAKLKQGIIDNLVPKDDIEFEDL